jgi:hypothetical protein
MARKGYASHPITYRSTWQGFAAADNRTDTLPALSGITTRYQEVTIDLYLAGFGKSDLTRGLLRRTPNFRYQQAAHYISENV